MDVELMKDIHYIFLHREFPEMGFTFFPEGNSYRLQVKGKNKNDQSDYNYMAEVTMDALRDLGGSFDGKLWDWSYKKWEDVGLVVRIATGQPFE